MTSSVQIREYFSTTPQANFLFSVFIFKFLKWQYKNMAASKYTEISGLAKVELFVICVVGSSFFIPQDILLFEVRYTQKVQIHKSNLPYLMRLHQNFLLLLIQTIFS